MTTDLLTKDCDPMGCAIADYHKNKKASTLRVFSSQFDEDEIPVSELFRNHDSMSALEKQALELAHGAILDVGSGSGCHALVLQGMDKRVCAIDISPLSVETMKERGVEDCRCINLFDVNFKEKFDTILMLMNGSGIIGKLDNMAIFFSRIRQLLNPQGRVILDSSDLRYLFEEEDGSFSINLADDYYGEVDFQMQYKNVKGKKFNWLYVDFETLSYYATENGFTATMICEGEHYDYLAALSLD